MLAERGLVISAGKMSGLWSGDPASIKLSDLDVICVVLGCGVQELLIPEPDKVSCGTEQEGQAAAAQAAAGVCRAPGLLLGPAPAVRGASRPVVPSRQGASA
jgi:DNA-binding Xre family transcriptional regulator